MTVEQFISDLDELVDWVRLHLQADHVTILGHSWGTVLGVLYAARFPEKVAVYVGAAQIGDWPAGEAASYAFALEEAGRRQNRKALKALRAMGPPPHTARQLFSERTWIERMEGHMDAMWPMLSRFMLAEHVTELRMPAVFFLGRLDRWVPPAVSVEFIDQLDAPSKRIVCSRNRATRCSWMSPFD